MEDARGMDVSALSFIRKGTTITTLEDDYVNLMKEAGDESVVDDARKQHQSAVSAAKKVLADVVPIVHSDDDS
jgi:hypothetical protein